MNQRGRKSALAVSVFESVERPEPLATLTEAQVSVWIETVNSCPADWFSREHLPLLEAYCRHVVYGRQLAAELDKVEPESLETNDGLRRHELMLRMHEKESRSMSSLATRLRMTHQSVYDTQKAARLKNSSVAEEAKPWEMQEAA